MSAAGAALRFQRLLKAPRGLVFAAVTEPALMRRWMCPENFAVTELHAEPEVGGAFRIVMQGPDGARYPVAGEYLEVRPPEALSFTWTWEEPHTLAGVTTRVRLRLAERDGGTQLTMIHSNLPTAEERESHRGGWTGALAKLARLVAAPPDVNGETERWTT